MLSLPSLYADLLTKGTSVLFIGAVAAVLLQGVGVSERAVYSRNDAAAADNLRARKIYTQVRVIGKMMPIVVSAFAVSSLLMLMSYVVVHIWDDRRLVVPLSCFIEKSFQNWTRTSAGLLGTVFVWVDYSFLVEEGRKFLKQTVEPNPVWDKRFWNLAVTDATDRTMQLRVLATAEDSLRSWDLRCDIREKFIAYIQKSCPQCRPWLRINAAIYTMETMDSRRIEFDVESKASIAT